jgi:hypothetical protein
MSRCWRIGSFRIQALKSSVAIGARAISKGPAKELHRPVPRARSLASAQKPGRSARSAILAQQGDVLREAALNAAPTDLPRGPSGLTPPPVPPARPRKPPRRKAASLSKQRSWQLERYQHVHELAAQDWSQRAIAHHLHSDPNTVRKYLHLEHFVGEPPQSTWFLGRALSSLSARALGGIGCRMVKTLWKELRAQGFTGSY